jgi:acyl-CoA thioester hydrolase
VTIEPGAIQVPLDITVRFAETDAMGVVHHSAYIVWFEAGRIAWLAAAGMPYAAIAEAGYNFAVTEVSAQYRAAVRFGDPVQVVTTLTDLRSRRIAFAYEVRHVETHQRFATGHSSHICVDNHGRTVKVPEWVMDRLQPALPERFLPSRNEGG